MLLILHKRSPKPSDDIEEKLTFVIILIYIRAVSIACLGMTCSSDLLYEEKTRLARRFRMRYNEERIKCLFFNRLHAKAPPKVIQTLDNLCMSHE